MCWQPIRGADRFNIEHVRQTLVGTWRLLAWENQASDGKVGQPFGDQPVGDGAYMAVATIIRLEAPNPAASSHRA